MIDYRIHDHPILKFNNGRKVKFIFEGMNLEGFEGEPIVAALHANGVKSLRKTHKLKRSRGFYCANENCSSCFMVVNGVSNVRVCAKRLEEGMIVERQKGKGDL